MKRDNIAKYLENIFKLFNIPILYVYDGEIQHRFEPYAVASYPMAWNEINKRIMSRLNDGQNPQKHIFFHVGKDMIFSGFLRSKTSDDCVLLGPFALSNVSKKNIENFLFSHSLTAEAAKKLALHFSGNHFLSLERCIYLLIDINFIINEEMLEAEDLLPLYLDSEISPPSADRTVSYPEIKELVPDNTDYPKEQNHKIKMYWCISHGEPKILQVLIDQLDAVSFGNGYYINLTLQETKNHAIGSIAIGRFIAEMEGVSPDKAMRIFDTYLNKIEYSQDKYYIHQCITDSLVDFAKAVQKMSAFHTSNPTVNRVISYIQANINNKITVPDIITNLKLNRTYLFESFKKETGKSITEFINEEKIKRSVYYLEHTDNSMIEIANFFSFSSQSYYQTLFKKIMGCTPTEYRQKHQT